jgi:hypothetical protein
MMNHSSLLCQYDDREKIQCTEQANASGYCYWHDKNIDKSDPAVKNKLMAYVRSGGVTRGIYLSNADLSQIDLVNHKHNEGYDFSYADFYHANLSGAHLFNIKLEQASLMKADLSYAKLNCAIMHNTNLLGIKWTGCKIEHIHLSDCLKQELLAEAALKQQDIKKASDYFQQAEEIYRGLRKHAEQEGIFALAGVLIQRELTMRRKQMPIFSFKRLLSKLVYLFCGYGEAPLKIIGLSIGIIIFCAFIYTFTGLNYQGQNVAYQTGDPIEELTSLFFSCLYYSVVTFTTLGYGDFTPVGISRSIAAIEAFTGSFAIALFVVVFVKKMTR